MQGIIREGEAICTWKEEDQSTDSPAMRSMIDWQSCSVPCLESLGDEEKNMYEAYPFNCWFLSHDQPPASLLRRE